jgi:hypothetical protein
VRGQIHSTVEAVSLMLSESAMTQFLEMIFESNGTVCGD